MDCQNKTSKTQTMVVYDINDKVRQSSNGPFEESYIIPDTVAEKILYMWLVEKLMNKISIINSKTDI